MSESRNAGPEEEQPITDLVGFAKMIGYLWGTTIAAAVAVCVAFLVLMGWVRSALEPYIWVSLN